VRVPEDAAAGKAIMRLDLPKDSKQMAVPTELVVELVTKEK
jgi:hypothetical protein